MDRTLHEAPLAGHDILDPLADIVLTAFQMDGPNGLLLGFLNWVTVVKKFIIC